MYATLTSKGQITIPAALRALFNWKAGDTLDFIVHDQPDARVEIVAKKNSVTKLKGLIGKPRKTVTLADMDAAIGLGG